MPGEPEYRPGFEHTYIYDPATERRHGAVQWHDTVPRIIDRQHQIRESLHPRYPPMLVPPRPWTQARAAELCCVRTQGRSRGARDPPQYNKGGYLLLDSLMMRGAYGPYGPAKAQVEALHDEELRAKAVRARRCVCRAGTAQLSGACAPVRTARRAASSACWTR